MTHMAALTIIVHRVGNGWNVHLNSPSSPSEARSTLREVREVVAGAIEGLGGTDEVLPSLRIVHHDDPLPEFLQQPEARTGLGAKLIKMAGGRP